MAYFSEFPNVDYTNRFPNAKSNDETTVAKNLFRRPKLRNDVSQSITQFEYYNIEDGERPEEVARKVYQDPELDWVVLIANNIINVNEDWPLSSAQLPEYLLKKYGSEAKLAEIKHYETIELKDSFGRIVVPGGLIVDKAFYDAPEFEKQNSLPPGITFPPIYLNPITGVATAGLSTAQGFEDTLASITVTEPGRGYTETPLVVIGAPALTSDASATVGIQSFYVSEVTGLIGGGGYVVQPDVVIDAPPISVQGIATCGLGSGIESELVKTIYLEEGGIGYGVTAPEIVFDLPRNFVGGASYKNESPISVGSALDGMYFRSDGRKVYTTSGIGTSLIRGFNLSTPWEITTLTQEYSINVTSLFSYCSGLEFSPDGFRMYVTGGKSGSVFVAYYSLGTAWDLTTAVYVNQMPLTAPGGVRLKNDGTRMYILNSNSPDSIEEYYLATPWNITTKIYVDSYSIETPTGDNQILGFSFNPTATKMFATGVTNASIYEFNLESSWDLSTLSYVNNAYVGDRIPNPSDVYINSEITALFISGGNADKIFQYSVNVRALGYAELNEYGTIEDIVITNPGLGYTVPPAVNITAPYPAVQATAVASLSGGVVTGINLTNAGFGYTSIPSVGITTAPYYRNALGVASFSNGTITGVTIIDPGKNYYQIPSITFIGNQQETVNVEVGDLYSQADKTWKWSGTDWEEKITDEFEYLDGVNLRTAVGSQIAKPITNYEYEIQQNDVKRLIILPKPEFIPVILKDLKDMMKYSVSTYRKNNKNKGTYNSKLTGV